MNRFIIVDGLPFLYADGKAYAVRWDDKGFTVGAEVELASAPTKTYSEISIKAKCAGHLDSIGQETSEEQDKEPGQEETSNETEGTATDNQETEPEQVEAEGQETSEEQDKEPGQEQPEGVNVSDNLEDMKLEELKEYAANNNIALKGARTKGEIIEAIRSAKG